MSTYPPILDQFVVVLCEPRIAINVGMVMRAMKNMGLHTLRLVNPKEMDLDRTQISGHRTTDILERMQTFESLDDALADCQRAVGLSSRTRTRNWMVSAARERAPGLLELATQGQRIALVYGRESSGLTNEELKRCDEFITIPTRTDYASLNLAQAVLLIGYELFLEASDGGYVPVDDGLREPSTLEERARLLAQIEHTLDSIGFFKDTRTNQGVMHKIRRMFSRSQPDTHEARALTGVFTEILKFSHLIRKGIVPPDLAEPIVPMENVDKVRAELQQDEE